MILGWWWVIGEVGKVLLVLMEVVESTSFSERQRGSRSRRVRRRMGVVGRSGSRRRESELR